MVGRSTGPHGGGCGRARRGSLGGTPSGRRAWTRRWISTALSRLGLARVKRPQADASSRHASNRYGCSCNEMQTLPRRRTQPQKKARPCDRASGPKLRERVAAWVSLIDTCAHTGRAARCGLLHGEGLRAAGRLAVDHDLRGVTTRRPAIGLAEAQVGGFRAGGGQCRVLLARHLPVLGRSAWPKPARCWRCHRSSPKR